MSARQYTPREMIEALIAFPTVSSDSNLALIEFVQSYLDSHGIASKLVRSDCGQKANLFATVGPSVPGGVVLSGHTDVVPVDGQPWDTNPFELVEADGKLFGRGTCDMKSFFAIALALVPEMAALQKPIHFALSYDEEIGCLGAPRLIEAIKAELPEPLAVVVGEPTSMRVVTGHKGIFHFDTVVRGFEAHSSQQHRGVPAVMYAGRLINWLAEKQADNAAKARADCPFEPAYTTLHCGVVHGGTAHNICARECTFVTDIRTMPDECPQRYFEALQRYAREELEPAMQAVHPHTGIDFKVHAEVPGFAVSEDEPAVLLAKQLTGQNESEVVPYGAESGQFQAAGFSVVMCGPGSIDQAHQPNEFIELTQVDQGVAFVRRLITRLAS